MADRLKENISAEAYMFLREIRANPYFHEILAELGKCKPQIFKSIRKDTLHVEDQNANWHYESGKSRERSRMTDMLSGENDD